MESVRTMFPSTLIRRKMDYNEPFKSEINLNTKYLKVQPLRDLR